MKRLSLLRSGLPAILGQIQQLKDGFGLALAVLFMFGFFWGVIKIWSGANAISKGDPDGKAGIVAGIVIAAYHTQLQAFPEQKTFCDTMNPCTNRYVWEFGFVSLPLMNLVALLFILVMLIVSATSTPHTEETP